MDAPSREANSGSASGDISRAETPYLSWKMTQKDEITSAVSMKHAPQSLYLA
jgi:hypothetical protein